MKKITHFQRFSINRINQKVNNENCKKNSKTLKTYLINTKVENIYFKKKLQSKFYLNINREIMKLN